jgi:hypothetical protein
MPPEQEPVIVLPEKFEDAWRGEDDILRRRKRLHLCSRAAAKARRDGHGSGWIQLRNQAGKLLAWINLDAYGADEGSGENAP